MLSSFFWLIAMLIGRGVSVLERNFVDIIELGFHSKDLLVYYIKIKRDHSYHDASNASNVILQIP